MKRHRSEIRPNILQWCELYRNKHGEYDSAKFDIFVKRESVLKADVSLAYFLRRTLYHQIDLEKIDKHKTIEFRLVVTIPESKDKHDVGDAIVTGLYQYFQNPRFEAPRLGVIAMQLDDTKIFEDGKGVKP